VVVKVAWVGWSFGGDLGGGGAGGALVDDGLAGGECLEGEVVDCSGVAAVGLVDQGGGVVGEQGVAASGEGEVVALMRSSSLAP
jgi:hypothetical protein